MGIRGWRRIFAIGGMAAFAVFAVSCRAAEKRLKPFGTVAVPAVAAFVAAEHFIANVNNDPQGVPVVPEGVTIFNVDPTFKRCLLGKIEEKIPAMTLTVYTLDTICKNSLILAELGDRAETSLAHLWALLEKQPNGPYSGNGALYSIAQKGIPSAWNVFYIRGTDGNLWAVEVYWYQSVFELLDNGWSIGARAVREVILDKEFRIFSR